MWLPEVGATNDTFPVTLEAFRNLRGTLIVIILRTEIGSFFPKFNRHRPVREQMLPRDFTLLVSPFSQDECYECIDKSRVAQI